MASQITKPLRHFLSLPQFIRKDRLSDSGQIIAWWESRRIFYNIVTLGAGAMSGWLCLISLAVSGLLLGVPLAPNLLPLVMGVVFLFMANFCYTGGWILEILLVKCSAPGVDRFATGAFKVGVIFSVALALIPGVFLVSLTVVQLIARLFA